MMRVWPKKREPRDAGKQCGAQNLMTRCGLLLVGVYRSQLRLVILFTDFSRES